MTIGHAEFDDSGTIAFGSLSGTYQNLLVLSDDADIIFIFNTTDVPVLLKTPSGVSGTKEIRLPAKTSQAIDFRPSESRLATGTIQVKAASGTATEGEVTITVVR